jgi:uncharacterized protein YdhG (YjbR/CyaY superfamily)
MMTAQTIDEYLAQVPDDQRRALERLRTLIREAAPEAIETISYGRPAFRLDGRYFVGFGVTRNGCSFFTGRAPIDSHAAELASYRMWKGTLNFRPDQPLPGDLVTRLVVDRLAEFRAR